MEAPSVLSELGTPNVGHLLIMDTKKAWRLEKNGRIIIETDDEVLLKLDNYEIR